MADGHEEREQREMERKQSEKKDRSDWIDHYPSDQWTPERRDS